MPERKKYKGSRRKLILAFDLGTTASGISYSVLNPGEVPKVESVTRYPGQSYVGGDCKIPTEIYYSTNGTVKAAGAEAREPHNVERAEEEGWSKAKWFKLHMVISPQASQISSLNPPIPPLPPNKTVEEVFADFFRYLLHCARLYIQETHVNGGSLWKSVCRDISYVLTHPNGWKEVEQTRMLDAAKRAELVPDNPDGEKRVSFISEGEASLRFCMQHEVAPDSLKNGEAVVIVDAGGGTIDVSAFKKGETPSALQEISQASCHLQGSVFVTQRACDHIAGRLNGSKFEEDIDRIVDDFDSIAKLGFKDRSIPTRIRFGSARTSSATLGISNGHLKLSGSDLASFFEPSVSCIVQTVRAQMANLGSRRVVPLHLFFVGGFSANAWVFSEVRRRLGEEGLRVCRPDRNRNKTACDGALIFALEQEEQRTGTTFMSALSSLRVRNTAYVALGVAAACITRNPRVGGAVVANLAVTELLRQLATGN